MAVVVVSICTRERQCLLLDDFNNSDVPADKAAQNVIVVCKKYYLQVVLKEIETTATYVTVHAKTYHKSAK